MADPRFYTRGGPLKLGVLAPRIGAKLVSEADVDRLVHDVALLDAARPETLTYCADRRHRPLLGQLVAGACLVTASDAQELPSTIAGLIAADPRRAFAAAAALLYPPIPRVPGIHPSAVVDATAKIGDGVFIGPCAVVGARAEIGARTVVDANAVIGDAVAVGQDCVIGPHVSIAFSLIGDRVILHGGVRIGQDGFGFVMSASGHMKVPHLGRVIIQDDVEIGANSTVDRGATDDTVIGLGTKIDNLVQIGHNVKIGRGCVLAGQAGVSGSSVLGDFVAVGGQVGVSDHVTVGPGAQLAGQSGIMRDVPAREVHMGSPARPMKAFMRELAIVSRLARQKGRKDD